MIPHATTPLLVSGCWCWNCECACHGDEHQQDPVIAHPEDACTCRNCECECHALYAEAEAAAVAAARTKRKPKKEVAK